MDKRWIPFLLLSTLTFSGCHDVKEESVLRISDPVDLSFDMSDFQLERGGYQTLHVTVETTSSEATKKVNFSIQQDGEVIDFVTESSLTDGMVSIVGKNIGNATLVATSADNPDCSTSIQIEVVKRVPGLSEVWQNVNQLTNYTIYNEKIKDDNTTEPSTQIEVTENALLNESFQYDEETKEWSTATMFGANDTGNYLLGYGIDKNNYAFLLYMDKDGNWIKDSAIAKSQRGFLTKDTFLGFKDQANSTSDVGIFYGLQAINPSWLPTAKTKDNLYTIEGSEEDTNGYYVKYLLWGLIDPIGKIIYEKKHASLTKISDLTDIFSLTIKAETPSSISMDLTYHDGIIINNSSEDYQYHSSLKNISTTDTSSINGLSTFLSDFEASYPSLSEDLQLFEDAVLKHDYVYSRELYWMRKGFPSNPYHGTFYVYYTEEYLMAYYSQSLVDAYNSYVDQSKDTTLEKLSIGGFGVLKKSDGIHEFTYKPSEENVLTVESTPLKDTSELELYQCDFGLTKEFQVPNFFDASDFYQNHTLNCLSSEPFTIFEGIQPVYFTNSQQSFADLTNYFLGDSDVHGVDFYSGISVRRDSYDTTKLSSITFFAAYSEDRIGYRLLYTPTLSDFGNTAAKNPAHSVLHQACQAA